jgi:hypothetical protein
LYYSQLLRYFEYSDYKFSAYFFFLGVCSRQISDGFIDFNFRNPAMEGLEAAICHLPCDYPSGGLSEQALVGCAL